SGFRTTCSSLTASPLSLRESRRRSLALQERVLSQGEGPPGWRSPARTLTPALSHRGRGYKALWYNSYPLYPCGVQCMPKAGVVGGIFGLLLLGAIVYFSLGLQQHTCEVCMDFQ